MPHLHQKQNVICWLPGDSIMYTSKASLNLKQQEGTVATEAPGNRVTDPTLDPTIAILPAVTSSHV